MKIRPYTEDIQVLAYLFQRSLEGDVLEWFYTLSIKDMQNFFKIRDKFFEKYSHRTILGHPLLKIFRRDRLKLIYLQCMALFPS